MLKTYQFKTHCKGDSQALKLQISNTLRLQAK